MHENNAKFFMKDVQKRKDNRGLKIKEVGISDIFLPIFVSDKKNQKQQVIANIKASVGLSRAKKGVHMSRFLEIISKYQNFNFNNLSAYDLLQEIKNKLDSSLANIEISFMYFIEKIAPVSQKKFLMGYPCKIISRIFRNGKVSQELIVEIPVSSVCPCSKEISKIGAHNQRGVITIYVETASFIWLEELIEIAEKSASGVLYPILKRIDEKYVVEKMFNKPKFVEDTAREVALRLKKDKRIINFTVECTNYESIHNHNVYAKITSK